ncbi:MAG: hypothetical protein RMK20_09705 [Verrucomicrobiales bacterium]|nr:hypothetical protein [Verrucomicrobiales bacterium]
MKRPTLNFMVVWFGFNALALAGAAPESAQPPPVESPQIQARPVPSAPEPSPVRKQPRLSPWAREVLKLSQAGVSPAVVEAFIGNAGVFALGADEIIYLRDLGVSEEVIERMLQHDRDLITGAMPPATVTAPPYEPLVFTAPKAPAGSSLAANAPTIATDPHTSVVAGAAANAFRNETAEPVARPADARAETSAVTTDRRASASTPKMSPAPTVRKSDSIYRVREPQPVELLPPILFINAYEPPPNTLVIVGFPKS